MPAAETPTHQLSEALEAGRWQNGAPMTEREMALVGQLLAARHRAESAEAQLDAVQGQYRGT